MSESYSLPCAAHCWPDALPATSLNFYVTFKLGSWARQGCCSFRGTAAASDPSVLTFNSNLRSTNTIQSGATTLTVTTGSHQAAASPT